MKRLFTGAIALALSLAASAATLSPIQLLNPAGSTSGQAIVSTGASSAPAWGNVTATALVAQAANTVVANATGSSASPTAFAMPSCSTSSSALDWTSGTGFTCNASINASTLGAATFAAPGPIGSTSASTGAFTTLSASSTVSGAGFSTYLASPPAIGTTAPAAGKFTTLQATSAITPSSTTGIVGTTTNDNANAGSVGEYASNSTTGTSVTTLTPFNATSVSLTAGDWDVSCLIQWLPAGSTVIAQTVVGVSTTSATLGALGTVTASPAVNNNAGSGQTLASPVVRESFASTTTVYCVGNAAFGVSTMTASGFIRARRVR